EILAIPADEALLASAKAGIGIGEILEAIVERIPHPKGHPTHTMRALVFDPYRGVVIYVRVVDGSIKAGDPVKMMATNGTYEVKEVGIFKPQQPKFFAQPILNAGDVGYVIANIKTTSEVKVGDTLTNGRTPAEQPLPGFQLVQPMVFSGI